GHATNALLVETNFTLRDQDSVFGRFEVGGKTAHELALDETEDTFTVAKLQGGYTRYLPAFRRIKPGIGGALSVGLVPNALKMVYGSRANVGAAVFLTVRPTFMSPASHSAQSGGSGGMVMVQTSLDPARLTCSPPIDPRTAPSTIFEGQTYYFCSERD